MPVTRWDPFGDLMSIQNRVNRLFQESLSRRGEEDLETGQWTPPVDIFESPERIVVRADIPGVEQSAIEIKIDDNILMVRGDRKQPGDVKPDSYHRAERPYGSFVRSFSLPRNVDQTAIRAAQKNGVLEITLPKKQEARPRSIQVDVK